MTSHNLLNIHDTIERLVDFRVYKAKEIDDETAMDIIVDLIPTLSPTDRAAMINALDRNLFEEYVFTMIHNRYASADDKGELFDDSLFELQEHLISYFEGEIQMLLDYEVERRQMQSENCGRQPYGINEHTEHKIADNYDRI